MSATAMFAVLRAGGSGIERRARQLAAIWPVQYQGSIQPSLFDSTKSARDYKVPDLPMLLIGGLQGAAALSCQGSGY